VWFQVGDMNNPQPDDEPLGVVAFHVPTEARYIMKAVSLMVMMNATIPMQHGALALACGETDYAPVIDHRRGLLE